MGLLVAITFVVELGLSLLVPRLGTGAGLSWLVDPLVLALVCAVAFWRVGIGPLQAALARENELNQRIVDGAADFIVTIAPDGTILRANAAALQAFGYTEDELLGRDVSLLMTEPHASQHAGYVRRYLGSRQPPLLGRYREVEGQRKDGSTIPLEITISEIGHGESLLFTGIMRDISQQKEVERSLVRAMELAEETAKTKSEFLANMSHEIRTPLNGVVGMTELLASTGLDGSQREYAAVACASAEALLSLVDDILDFSKLEAGRLELEELDYDPIDVLEEVGALVAYEAQGKGLEIAILPAGDLPRRMRGDRARVRQVLLNLAKNAVKFTPAGEIVLAAALQSDDLVQFSVEDTGIGIPADRHDRLFEPFSQIDASTTRRFGGTGLGLAISKQLVKRMGGRIGVWSVEGKGSTFWFEIPSARGGEPAPPGPDPWPALELDGVPFLVVGRETRCRDGIVQQLRRFGCAVDMAPDGLAGLRAMRSAAEQGASYAGVLLEYETPGMQGLEFVLRAGLDESTSKIPICPITTMYLAHEVRRLGGSSCRVYLTRPVRRVRLIEALAIMLERQPAPARSAATEDAPRSEARPLKVLVVDDNRVNQLVAARMLQRDGHTVSVCGNGVEALAALGTTSFDVVLMDCQMPEMDGFEATQRIRQTAGRTSRLPIIAMTADALPGDMEKCLSAGMDGYLAKPLRAAELQAALREHVAGE